MKNRRRGEILAAFLLTEAEKENMAPKTPNYRQDRLQRERAQAAKHAEKAERRAEQSAKRKAAKDADAPGETSENNS